MAVPLKTSAIFIQETITGEPRLAKLDGKQGKTFFSEPDRIRRENDLITEWVQLFQQSVENKFLYYLLRQRKGSSRHQFQRKNPQIMAKALDRSKQAIESAAWEWNLFATECLQAVVSLFQTGPNTWRYKKDLDYIGDRDFNALCGNTKGEYKNG